MSVHQGTRKRAANKLRRERVSGSSRPARGARPERITNPSCKQEERAETRQARAGPAQSRTTWASLSVQRLLLNTEQFINTEGNANHRHHEVRPQGGTPSPAAVRGPDLGKLEQRVGPPCSRHRAGHRPAVKVARAPNPRQGPHTPQETRDTPTPTHREWAVPRPTQNHRRQTNVQPTVASHWREAWQRPGALGPSTRKQGCGRRSAQWTRRAGPAALLCQHHRVTPRFAACFPHVY